MPIESTATLIPKLFLHRAWWWNEAESVPAGREKSLEIINRSLYSINYSIKRILSKMPAKKKSKQAKVEWIGYQNISIPTSMVEGCEKYIADTKEVWSDYTEILVEGYTVKMYYDKDEESYKATLTCFIAESPNAGFALSAFGGDWFTALAVVLYKHSYVADGDWSSVANTSKRKFG